MAPIARAAAGATVATAALITAAAARAMLNGVLVHQRHPKRATAPGR
jgi:hypothetical protein